jgi:hypothetical protein
MPLFIDHLPLHSWTDNTHSPPRTYWSVGLPVLIAEAGLASPPSGLTEQRWYFDSGNVGEAFAWRHHLIVAGLNPDQNQWSGSILINSSVGGRIQVPVRQADVWLVGNVPAFQNAPYRLELERGIAFRNVPILPDPQLHRPLIGMRAVRRARLRMEVDFMTDTVSVWTPDPP